MTQQTVEHAYRPREYARAFHARSQRFALCVWHRRAGKTFMTVNDMVIRAMRTQKRNAFYAYVAPYFGQAKQVSWTYIKDAVRGIPGARVHESETAVTLPNGAKIRVFGADNADALRGLYFDGVVLDEFGDMAGRVWTEVIRPALADRQGWAVFIGTPRGKNKFYEMHEAARINDRGNWFYLNLPVSETGALPESELAALRAEMSHEEYQQEFECSFEATIRGSYYGRHVTALELGGRILYGEAAEALYDMSEPVSISHDPGANDAWAIWFWQVVAGEVRIIDYWEESSFDVDEVMDMLALKPYRWGTWWVPHDALHRTARSKKSILDVMREHEAPARKVPNPDAGSGILHGVNAVRKVLRTYPLRINGVRCARGLEALRNYSRKWDADTRVYNEKPKHDQWSNGADAFRYFALSIDPTDIQRSAEAARERQAALTPWSARTPTPVNNTRTAADVFDTHFKRVRSLAASGRARI